MLVVAPHEDKGALSEFAGHRSHSGFERRQRARSKVCVDESEFGVLSGAKQIPERERGCESRITVVNEFLVIPVI